VNSFEIIRVNNAHKLVPEWFIYFYWKIPEWIL